MCGQGAFSGCKSLYYCFETSAPQLQFGYDYASTSFKDTKGEDCDRVARDSVVASVEPKLEALWDAIDDLKKEIADLKTKEDTNPK